MSTVTLELDQDVIAILEQQHQPIGTNAKFPIADLFYLINRKLKTPVAIVENDKIISSCLILEKFELHWKS